MQFVMRKMLANRTTIYGKWSHMYLEKEATRNMRYFIAGKNFLRGWLLTIHLKSRKYNA